MISTHIAPAISVEVDLINSQHLYVSIVTQSMVANI